MKSSYSVNKVTIALGIAFLLQGITSLISGAVLLDPFVVSGDITATMQNFSAHSGMINLAIMLDLVTAIGVIFLAVMLRHLFNEEFPILSNIGLSLYIFEAGLLAISKIAVFGLLTISKSYTAGADAQLVTLGQLLFDVKGFAYSLHIIPFGIGATIFYALLYKSGVLPKWIGLWGVITAPIVLIGTLLMMQGINVPFFIMLPYVPYEYFVGVLILIKGLQLKNSAAV